MLPSRGAIRSLSSVRTGLSSPSTPITSRLLDGRRFGTSTRVPRATWQTQAGVRPSVLRGAAGATLLAGSIPATRALSFWSTKPADAAQAVKPETVVPEAAAAAPSPIAPPTPIEAAVPASPVAELPSNIGLADLDALGINISDIPEQIGYLKALGLDFGWGPSSCMQWLLEHVYVYSGLPWWAAILGTTVLLRIALIHPALKAMRTSAKMQELQAIPEYNALKAQMQASLSSGDQVAMNESRMALSTLHKQHKVSPLSSLWGLVQIPFGYGTFVVLNNMAKLPVPSLETGGLLWFKDLTVSDPLYILPIMGPIAMVGMFYSNMSNIPAQSQAQMKLMAYVLVPISAFVAMWLPAGIQFYFVISTALAVLQNVILRNATIRRLTGLPPVQPTTPTSTTHISGALYQAPTARDPNTITVKAVETPAEETKKMSTFSAGMDSLRQTIHNAKGGVGNHVEVAKKEKQDKELKAWEAKRAEEDRKKFWAEVKQKKTAKDN